MQNDSTGTDLNRRTFFKGASMASMLALMGAVPITADEAAKAAGDKTLPPPKADPTYKEKPVGPPVKFGIIGLGPQGREIITHLGKLPNAPVVAICDHYKSTLKRAADAAPNAKAYNTAEELLADANVQAVVIATPTHQHKDLALAAMKAGKHCGSEVPIALTLDQAWALVETSEKTRRHCLMMENCCYGNSELTVLRMVREGVFGTLLHAEAAYNHDLRAILFENRDEGLWRRFPHTEHDTNLYPTHGLGPVAQYLGIHRGDRFEHIVSMSSPEAGLTEWREQHEPKDSPKWKETYKAGDVNTSLIKTAKGRTILLQHNVTSPRPYSRLNNLQGSKAVFNDYPPLLYIDGAAGGEKWTPLGEFKSKYEHPLWTAVGDLARKNGGHGGMDFIMAYRLVQCMREGLAPDFDVYDAAAWSVPYALCEQSVRKGSTPVKFPDFTRGAWRTSTAPQGPAIVAG